MNHPLRRGILPVLQTEFDATGAIDLAGTERLVEHALASGAAGFLVPAVASEVAFLTPQERQRLIARVCQIVAGRAPVIAGASAATPRDCRELGEMAESCGADVLLVAVPEPLYQTQDAILPFMKAATEGSTLPLLVQDLQFGGPGLDITTITSLHRQLPRLVGLKIETVPAGPKYTLVRERCGDDLFVAGGWATPQMIEGLDRGVDGLIPEASMVPVYRRIFDLHAAGERPGAVTLFRRLLPILAFSNQEIWNSVIFFKRLLIRKGIFHSAAVRCPVTWWDQISDRLADELIDYYLQLEANPMGAS